MNSILIVSTKPFIKDRYKELCLASDSLAKYKPYFVIGAIGGAHDELESANTVCVGNIGTNLELTPKLQQFLSEFGPFKHLINIDEFSLLLFSRIKAFITGDNTIVQKTLPLRDKVLMKDQVKSVVRTPTIYSIDEVKNGKVDFPIVGKPRAYAGAYGAEILNNMKEVNDFFERRNVNPEFEEFALNSIQFEEFIEGQLIQLDGVYRDGNVEFLNANECHEGRIYLQNKKTMSTCFQDEMYAETWKEYANTVLRCFDDINGAFHLECFQTPSGERVFLELGLRPGGGLVIQMIELGFGFDIELAHLQAQIGIPIDSDIRQHKIIGSVLFPKAVEDTKLGEQLEDHVVKEVIFDQSKSPRTLVWHKLPQVGDSVVGPPSFTRNLGSFLLAGESREEIMNDIQFIRTTYKVVEES